MDVTPSPTVDRAAPSSTPSAAIPGTGAINADFDTFLSLLTAQLKNQDPLKPVDSTEFVAQLAEFSAVEQQVQSNASLGDILETLRGGDITALADWLGTQVSTSEATQFSGQPITLSLTPRPEADAAQLVVRNEAGVEAARLEITSGTRSLVWTGENDLGRAPPTGRYRFTLEESAGGQKLPATEANAFVEVLEARLVDGTPQLTLSSGETVAITDVNAVRQTKAP